MSDWVGGLPRAAHDRVEAQRRSGVRGSLLSAPAVTALRAVGLEPVGEVFGCTVMNLGWQQGYCGAYSYGGGFGGGGAFGGGIVGTFGGGISGGAGAGYGRGGPTTYGWTTPVITSGSDRSAGFGPYVEAFETGWYSSVRRMVAEAKALGAEGVVGVLHQRDRLEARVHEYTALGTAVRAIDASVPASPLAKGEVWVSDLSPEDSAAAVRSGHLPLGIVLGMSVSTKHKDWHLKQQESVWAGNTEIQGMTELISAARHDARRRITHRAQRFGGGDLVISGSELHEFETPCRNSGGSEAEEDLHAEALFTGTVLAPPSLTHRRTRSGQGRVLTVMPLTNRTSRT